MAPGNDISQFVAAAEEAAQAAGSLIRDSWQQVKQIQYKSSIDLVTTIDHQSEELIVSILQKRFPNHSILAEEETNITGQKGEHRWIIDPVDGTTNFAHAYPHFCVSIALEYAGEIILGLVYDPIKEEKFSAVRGRGSFLNGGQIHTTKEAELGKALLATGFPYDRRQKVDFYLPFFKDFMLSCQGIRRNGSAALDLCYVACGRLDGFWEFGLSPWDTAAGSLMVQEAGGTMSDFSRNTFSVWKKEVLASNGWIHDSMLRIMQKTRQVDSPTMG